MPATSTGRPFAQTIRHFIAISRVANEESDTIGNAHGTVHVDGGRIFNTRQLRAASDEPHPALEALKAFLWKLPDDEVWTLLTLMYCGRERDDDLAGMADYLAVYIRNRDVAAGVILGKVPRGRYVEAALARLSGLASAEDYLHAVSRRVQVPKVRPS